MRRIGYVFTLALVLALCATASFAQDGKLKIKVTPPQAYVFVDGNAIREGSQSIKLAAGKHTVVVVNYGYKISTQDVNIEAGKTTDLNVALEAWLVKRVAGTRVRGLGPTGNGVDPGLFDLGKQQLT